MKKANYKNESVEELKKALAEKHEALAKFKFGISGSRTKNVKDGRNLHRDIARILTVLNTADANK